MRTTQKRCTHYSRAINEHINLQAFQTPKKNIQFYRPSLKDINQIPKQNSFVRSNYTTLCSRERLLPRYNFYIHRYVVFFFTHWWMKFDFKYACRLNDESNPPNPHYIYIYIVTMSSHNLTWVAGRIQSKCFPTSSWIQQIPAASKLEHKALNVCQIAKEAILVLKNLSG